MTRRLPRHVEPYTNNVAYSTITSEVRFQEGIIECIKGFFEDTPLIEECLDSIWDIATNYEIGLASNPDRKISQQQRQDVNELLATLYELQIRLNPLHLPLPLIARAKAAYQPGHSHAPSFEVEILNVLHKIDYLSHLVQEAGIPTPRKTNPGKPERDALIEALCALFDQLAKRDTAYGMSSQDDLCTERRDFVKKVCALIDPAIKVPRHI